MKNYKKAGIGTKIFLITLGLAIISFFTWLGIYTHVEHKDWVVIDANVKNTNCHKVTTTSNSKGRSRTKTETRCNRTVTYTYEGKPYIHTERDMPESTKTQAMINPRDPDDYTLDVNDHGTYLICGIFGGIGIFLLITGIIA